MVGRSRLISRAALLGWHVVSGWGVVLLGMEVIHVGRHVSMRRVVIGCRTEVVAILVHLDVEAGRHLGTGVSHGVGLLEAGQSRRGVESFLLVEIDVWKRI